MNEGFYQIYKSGKRMEEIVEELIPASNESELELARVFKSANERLEKKCPHYLARYLKERDQED